MDFLIAFVIGFLLVSLGFALLGGGWKLLLYWWEERQARKIEPAIIEALVEEGLVPYISGEVHVVHENGVPKHVLVAVRPDKRRELAQDNPPGVRHPITIPGHPNVAVRLSWYGSRVETDQ